MPPLSKPEQCPYRAREKNKNEKTDFHCKFDIGHIGNHQTWKPLKGELVLGPWYKPK